MYHEPGSTSAGADDAALIARLARALAIVDPLPPDAEATASELFTWRTVDAELAELLRTGLLRAPAGTD